LLSVRGIAADEAREEADNVHEQALSFVQFGLGEKALDREKVEATGTLQG
jgi:hypothetical protein